MRLSGKWRILIQGDERSLGLLPWQRNGLDYLLKRLLDGKDVAPNALEHYGVFVRQLGDDDEIIVVPDDALRD